MQYVLIHIQFCIFCLLMIEAKTIGPYIYIFIWEKNIFSLEYKHLKKFKLSLLYTKPVCKSSADTLAICDVTALRNCNIVHIVQKQKSMVSEIYITVKSKKICNKKKG